MAKINKSQFAILGCLSIKPMSAYEIKQFIARTTAYFWSEGEGQLYPTLKKLTESKAVTFKEEASAKKGVKKVYTITNQGQIFFKEWLNKKVSHPPYRNELLLKMFFGSMQSAQENIDLLQQEAGDLAATKKILITIKDDLENKELTKEQMVYGEITLDHGIVMLQSMIDWCENSIKKIKNI